MSRAVGNHNLMRAIAKRSYAAQAAVKPTLTSDISVNTATNKLRLVAAKPNYPVNKVCITYKAGSRYELPDNFGLTYVLRHSIVLSTREFSSFNLHRIPVQHGLNLYASADRETFTYTVEAHPSKIEGAIDYVVGVATKPYFKPWELSDNISRIKLDLLGIPPQVKTLDLLHKAAYRNSLGNSLFADPSGLDKLSYEDLWHFVKQHFTSSRAQVTSIGLTHSDLEKIVPLIELEANEGPANVKSVYSGGEIRIPNYKENVTYVAVAGEAPGFTQKEYLAYAVLPFVFANNPPTKYGNSQGILNKTLTQANVVAAVTGLHASYSDSSLIGFFFAASNSDAAKGYEAVINAFLKSNVTDQDVARGKAQLKVSLLANAEGSAILDVLTKQVVADSIITPEQAAVAVDAVTVADVKQAAKKLVSGKLAVAVHGGDVGNLVYADTIKK